MKCSWIVVSFNLKINQKTDGTTNSMKSDPQFGQTVASL